MATQISLDELIASRYASALYDLASEKKNIDKVLSDLLILKEYIENNNNLKLLLKSPLIASSIKYNIINKILISHSPNALTDNFLKVIESNKRFNKLINIILTFNTINLEKRGDVIAEVTSAHQLSEDQKNSIEDELKKVLGKNLNLNYFEDKDLIGGFIIKVGSKMIDASLASKINKLQIAMKEIE